MASTTLPYSSLLSPRMILLSKLQCKWKGHSCLTFNGNISLISLNKKSTSCSIFLTPPCHFKAEILSNTVTENTGERIFRFLKLFSPFFPILQEKDRIYAGEGEEKSRNSKLGCSNSQQGKSGDEVKLHI